MREPGPSFRQLVSSYMAEPVDVTVVDDKRDTFGKRLAILAVGLLIMLFGILAYIQSAKNGEKLDRPIVLPTPSVIVRVKPTPVPSIIKLPGGSRTVIIVPSPVPGKTSAPVPKSSQPPNKPKPKPTKKPKPNPKPSPSCTRPIPVVPIGICP